MPTPSAIDAIAITLVDVAQRRFDFNLAVVYGPLELCKSALHCGLEGIGAVSDAAVVAEVAALCRDGCVDQNGPQIARTTRVASLDHVDGGDGAASLGDRNLNRTVGVWNSRASLGDRGWSGGARTRVVRARV